MSRKWRNKDEYVFEKRWKDFSSDEKYEYAKSMYSRQTLWILMVIGALLVGILSADLSASISASTIPEYDDDLYRLSEGICDITDTGERISIVVGKEQTGVVCELRSFVFNE